MSSRGPEPLGGDPGSCLPQEEPRSPLPLSRPWGPLATGTPAPHPAVGVAEPEGGLEPSVPTGPRHSPVCTSKASQLAAPLPLLFASCTCPLCRMPPAMAVAAGSSTRPTPLKR